MPQGREGLYTYLLVLFCAGLNCKTVEFNLDTMKRDIRSINDLYSES